MRSLLPLLLAAACSRQTGHREQDTGHREQEAAAEIEPVKAKGFTPPDARTRARAVGTLMNLEGGLEAAFAPDAFTPIAAPLEDDWLAQHEEAGQTFDQYKRGRPNRPSAARRTIYLEPIGFPTERSPRERGTTSQGMTRWASAGGPPVEVVAEFARAHFQLPVKVLPPIALERTGAKVRDRGDFRQILAPDLLEHLKTRLPPDGYCLIGLTATDLYPEESWNFVFGMATLRERVGVYSTARYQPSFYGEEDHYPAPEHWVMRRSLKVMAHEIGHMFGMEHCTYYECVMNGSNHLDETDRRPVHLCPVCLRKLHYAIGFDPDRRYRDLERFFRKNKLGPEADWVRGRAEAIEAAGAR
ncbi:MAG TPA: archaemetzincin [Kofleriaceae bacterium]